MWYIIIAIVWLIGAIIAYPIIKKWDKGIPETIYFCIIWPLLIPLYIVHILHKKVF